MLTSRSITISWIQSNVIPISGYEIEYSYLVNRCSALPGPSLNETISSGEVRSYALRNLNEDSFYTITLRSINNEGSVTKELRTNTDTSRESVQIVIL